MTRNVLEYLESRAAKAPDKPAVTDGQIELSYGELLLRSQKIGSALAEKNCQNRPVAVFLEKGVPALCTFFGAVYAGAFYSSLNPELPDVRLTQVQSVLDAAVIVTDRDLLPRAQALFPDAQILLEETLSTAPVAHACLQKIRAQALDTDPLYVNFTSGSTGTPKGIVVGHRSVIDFMECFTDLFSITETDVIANQAPFDFDVSVKDIYSAIKTGAMLVIVPRRLFSAPVELLDFLCEHRVTTMIWAVSALCLISTFHGLDYKTPQTVNKVLFSGEVMPLRHLRSWMEHLPKARFVNLYGPTEITCNCTYHEIDRTRDYASGIPIGSAFPNEDVFLLDAEEHRITSPDTPGELCVRGSCLALGYYRAPKQNETVFVQNPLNPCYPERIYRTGDLGKYNADGELLFCGRKDFQIKYMGHRIELEEIERAMSAIPGIERCCCIFEEEKSRLKGFYIGTIEKKDLHNALKEKLPVFMIPGILRQVEEMPLTKNGKIDRKALDAMTRGGKR
ncbi:amino acid adenylation domain-containing protein [Yeguia hominis]|uniref:Amino acid adenylation domain-containing protein n=1 Tax=Yeguia hominis TaxID=2763662 RepID=A0A926HSE4_9FIRM|nr:amino acid adenylation domain-containing protein [Yeguia hominis]MBC8533750.1 amino acid adenylation domain-containing protein [Yeguia hominis]